MKLHKKTDDNIEHSLKMDAKTDSTQSKSKTKQPTPTTNTHFDETSGTHAKGPTKTKKSGNGISKAYTATEITNMLGADQHGISHVERMGNRPNQITTTVRTTFSTTISAFRILPSVPEVYTEWMPTVPSVAISYKNCRKQVH